jgi:putative oxidoreductase
VSNDREGGWIGKEEDHLSSLATLVLRLVIGGFMAGHGAQKLFGSFGGPGMEGTEAMVESQGLKPPRPWAVMGGVSEFGGGALTALGLLNPLGPIGVIAAMAMAAKTVHGGQPIWVTEGEAELPITNIAAATALMLGGPGKYSFDRVLGLRVSAWISFLALVAVVLAVVYGPEDQTDQEPAGEESKGEPGA